jgi:NADH-quinone oxidoreductase subunit F
MDLRLLLTRPTDAERAAVDAFLGPGGPLGVSSGNGAGPATDGAGPVDVPGRALHGGHGARAQRHLLLPVLEAVQERIGWISEGALGYICERLTVPPADAYGVATFYGLLSVEPRPARVLHVCDDIVCQCQGADELIGALEEQIGPEHTDADGCMWLRSPCLGQCDRAPAVLYTEAGEQPRERAVAPVGAKEALAALRGEPVDNVVNRPVPEQGEADLWLVRRVSVVDPRSLHDYRARGGYRSLRRAMALGPDKVIREVKESGLMGRGGAAFPTGIKWEAVARQPVQPHYLICNADESEPGTFKDRVLLEGDPFSVIEAMTIAAHATNCAHGYIYLRGEYPLAFDILTEALATARHHGYLGHGILRSQFSFDIEIRRGAGAYICGEETAIFNSIEGLRGEPRAKPPFPVERGLFGKPTVVNNAETLVNVLEVLGEGGRAYARTGSEQSTGTRLFCLSGDVVRPGVYEAVFGQTLGELLARAGGIRTGRALQAVLLGGAAGGFVGPDELDLPLTFEDVRAAGATLGSGVVIAFDEAVDLKRVLQRIAAFMRDESCGQCTPCRVGTVRQEEALARLVSERTRGTVADELALLEDLGTCMRDSSICGLGQTAASAISSAIARLNVFPVDGEEAERLEEAAAPPEVIDG